MTDDDTSTSLTRQQVYDAVWTEPVSVLAPRYGMSDRGLGKLCARHKIPVPPRGYWARKEHGHSVKQPPLPKAPTHSPEYVIHFSCEATSVVEDEEPFRAEIAFELEPKNQIHANTFDRLSDSEVVASLKLLTKCHPDERGIVTPPTGAFNVRVSIAMRERALRAVETLKRALAARDHQVKVVTKKDEARSYCNPEAKISKTVAVVLGEDIEFGIQERSVSVPPSRRKNNPTRNFGIELEPNGVMEFEILTWSSYGRRRWRDGKNKKIEDQFNSIMIGFLEAAFSLKDSRAEAERKRLERIAAEERQAELDRLREEENARIQSARLQMNHLEESNRLKVLIDSIKAAATIEQLEIQPGSELHSWLEWLSLRAATLDPLPKILAGRLSDFEIDENEEAGRPRYGYHSSGESRLPGAHWPFQHWSQRNR